MAEVKVLVEGFHDKSKGYLEASSTSVLIKTDKNILVDTGLWKDEEKLLKALKKEGIVPNDIEIIIATHLHLDHTANIHLFKNAKVIAKHNLPTGPGLRIAVSGYRIEKMEVDNAEIAKDVKTILTPGHVDDHISVVVDTDKGTVVIAGDALGSEKYTDFSVIPDRYWNLEEFNKNRKKILDMADYVIPGHGKMFKVEK
jgi:glyoxylase-like metal-dependent hydrolase (beta-lactamase superfamily II)